MELNSSGNVANVNVYAPDGLVARKEGSNWTYYTFDMQGSVVNKLNSSETTSTGRIVDAWGQGMETMVPTPFDPFGYNAKWGYYYDRETKLYLCQHRMYDASAGRWLNRDPIGYAGGVNLYGYCGGGPVGSADPSGFGWGTLPPTPGGLPPGWWQGGHGGPKRVPGGNGRYFPPGGLEAGDGLEFHPGVPGQPGHGANDHWHPVRNGQKLDAHLEPGQDFPDFIPQITPDCEPFDLPAEPSEEAPDFWRADNPWAWAAGAGLTVLTVAAVAVIVITFPVSAPAIGLTATTATAAVVIIAAGGTTGPSGGLGVSGTAMHGAL